MKKSIIYHLSPKLQIVIRQSEIRYRSYLYIAMKKACLIGILVVFITALAGFNSKLFGDDPVPIPASHQRIGDPQKGYAYLTTGDYVRSGIPYRLFQAGLGKVRDSLLNRDGLNATIPYQYTAIKVKDEIVVAPNCLQCHAQVFDGKLIMGLGNSTIDFTKNQKLDPKRLQMLENVLKSGFPKQYEAAAPFLTVTQAVGPYLTAEVRGVNTADRLATVLAAHRDPLTFRWSKEPLLTIPEEVVPTDTPPWWLLKKKNAMFYNGFGRGDFGRFLMASNLLTVTDTSESGQVDAHMPDVLAYIYSLKPPPYPKRINQRLARKGRIVFEDHCATCHGTYGKETSYPNLLIPETTIGTDSLLFRSNYSNPAFVNWFNNSWFTKGDHPAHLEPFNGYIAPPLDGIWITAPYLHNGSVPTLEALLNSKLRPSYWSRDFNHPEYDYDHVGWKYNMETKGGSPAIYNTTLPGYGNYGHLFGDELTPMERKAVIEYLKTL
jgi:Cytochrome c